jgi:uncharacterized membrane protein
MSTITRTRLGAAAFALAGVAFILYPALRPWQDETTVAGATEAMSSGAWIASHTFAMIGFILVALGVLSLRRVVSDTRAEPVALAAVAASWIGAGLILPYYGAETFGLYAVARHAAAGQVGNLLDVVDAVRFQPVAATTFALGLLLLAVGAVLAAVAAGRSMRLSRYRGALFAAGFVLFLPQFFTPPAVRIGHGALLAAGLFWLGLGVWRAAAGQPAAQSPRRGADAA